MGFKPTLWKTPISIILGFFLGYILGFVYTILNLGGASGYPIFVTSSIIITIIIYIIWSLIQKKK